MSSDGPDFKQRQRVLFLSKTSCPAEKTRKAGDHTPTPHLFECNRKLPRWPEGRSKLRRTELPARHLPPTNQTARGATLPAGGYAGTPGTDAAGPPVLGASLRVQALPRLQRTPGVSAEALAKAAH